MQVVPCYNWVTMQQFARLLQQLGLSPYTICSWYLFFFIHHHHLHLPLHLKGMYRDGFVYSGQAISLPSALPGDGYAGESFSA